eukprot:TRINITY_DN5223_c0_g4_i2.p1 TRINITY_DN5223_c0_g4~~TRINITY_DN5223_c0_g4_i2.p1  ORF type:complete len:458 (+),score=117.47 TRINITY_DN5223_c0_g4_i2:69-1442(+)
MSAPVINKRIDQYAYNDENVLGKGQFGTVYRGQNTQTGEAVAIKVIGMRVLENEYIAKLLINEIDALKKLRCQHIVRFIDLKITKNNIYLVTEFCDGGDLSAYLAKRKRLREEEVVELLDQICEAFKEMKRYNIIHRDLKPANILIHQGKLKLADLGFAKTVHNFQGSVLQSTVGSPIYMSPQLLLKQHYTSKCDVWSLGVIIFQLLNGEVPWKALDMFSLAQKIRTEPIAFKQGVVTSPQIRDLIFKCLKYEEQDRISWDDIFSHPIFASKRLTGHSIDGPQNSVKSNPSLPSFLAGVEKVPEPSRPSKVQGNQENLLPTALTSPTPQVFGGANPYVFHQQAQQNNNTETQAPAPFFVGTYLGQQQHQQPQQQQQQQQPPKQPANGPGHFAPLANKNYGNTTGPQQPFAGQYGFGAPQKSIGSSQGSYAPQSQPNMTTQALMSPAPFGAQGWPQMR